MVPTQLVRTDAEPFSHIAGLGPHGDDAAKKLRELHDNLQSLGARADAQRLIAADKVAERGDFAALERLATTEHPLDELSEMDQARVRRLVGWRNAAALFPLLITWLLLGWASYRYHQQLTVHPELSTQPFLVLWQQRFGGKFIPTFGETAFAAFTLLLVVLALTVRAQRLESRIAEKIADMSAQANEAMEALALAVQTSTIKPPMSAQEWAAAAQRVLAETQQLIVTAARDIKGIAETNREITTTAERAMAAGQEALVALHAEGKQFVDSLARESRETQVAVRADNAQFIERTADEARLVLQQASTNNRQLVEEQMTPLFQGFRSALEDYRADQEVYRASASALANGVGELSRSAQTLADSSKSYTDVAASIDQHLQLIESTQTEFVTRVTENSKSMTTAATAMREVTELMSGRLRGDLETLASNVTEASARLARVDADLATASTALAETTRAMQAVAGNLNTVARRLSAMPAAPPSPPSRRGGFLGGLLGR